MAGLFAGALVALAPLAASAAPVVLHNDGLTGPEVAKWLQDAGYKAELTTDKSGDPLVKSAAEGVAFSIYFYDCEAKPRCKAIQFSAGFDLKAPLTAAKINEWNRNHRYLKAYIDDEGDPHIEYDVNVNAGRTQAGLDDDFAVWTSMIGDFTTFIDW
ncbi:YbjN domain-containing protein [Caulobacter hibisci]|nr:YbjN domain-containing protein [Caulobacter hibisci]